MQGYVFTRCPLVNYSGFNNNKILFSPNEFRGKWKSVKEICEKNTFTKKALCFIPV